MNYVMGIDGGGSHMRVVVVDAGLTFVGSAEGGSANPNSAGREAAAQTIHTTIRQALAQARLSASQITAVGVGIAGTIMLHDWVRETVSAILPDAILRIASDFEIALVGARGERKGVLILAGTGSVAFGVNASGESAQVGGWGYLLGDEGSGYWLGLKTLQAVVRAADGRGQPTRLTDILLSALHLSSPQELIQWVYASGRTREIAQLAPLVLSLENDAVAQAIIDDCAAELVLLGRAVVRRLNIDYPSYALAGGLLSEANPLSEKVCAALGLESIPVPRYSPVIGAALLALTP